ncbi:hypothetical protein BDA96_09G091300 [Sorghum bicolor]|uniref:Uncharacterized protein n=2 Tax=Sorghum bicolor TaxID=4558 RepID=A0A921Q8G5_SORBI|nr:hypothetical protein BDA96_09G091300 [Sorghum bicolor]KXG21611.1 hypothetical protein SORBI_3009G086400 [Sorghum bicolor]
MVWVVTTDSCPFGQALLASEERLKPPARRELLHERDTARSEAPTRAAHPQRAHCSTLATRLQRPLRFANHLPPVACPAVRGLPNTSWLLLDIGRPPSGHQRATTPVDSAPPHGIPTLATGLSDYTSHRLSTLLEDEFWCSCTQAVTTKPIRGQICKSQSLETDLKWQARFNVDFGNWYLLLQIEIVPQLKF